MVYKSNKKWAKLWGTWSPGPPRTRCPYCEGLGLANLKACSTENTKRKWWDFNTHTPFIKYVNKYVVWLTTKTCGYWISCGASYSLNQHLLFTRQSLVLTFAFVLQDHLFNVPINYKKTFVSLEHWTVIIPSLFTFLLVSVGFSKTLHRGSS